LQTLSYCHQQQCPDQGLDLCDALSEVYADGKLLCPTLQSLVLNGIYFMIPSQERVGTRDRISKERDIGLELAHCLRSRSEQGNRLRELRIHDAIGLKDGTADVLEECVDDLQWNLYVRPPHPWDDDDFCGRGLPSSDLSMSP
jgi:hypothetical protein